MNKKFFFICFFCLLDIAVLNIQLNYFEKIDLKDIYHKVHKRSIENTELSPLRQIKFKAFKRNFNIILNSKKEILDANFRAVLVDKKGKEKEINVDIDEFYEGKLINNVNSDVIAHIEKNGLITGSIFDDQNKEAYFIEPYSNIFNKTKEDDYLIIYRQEDIKNYFADSNYNQTNKSLCGYIKVDDKEIDKQFKVKRQINEENFWLENKFENTKCSLKLVADHTFFEHMGNRDAKKTINFLVSLISQVDLIFKRTNWTYSNDDPNPLTDYGFLITEILIHEEPTVEDNNYLSSNHYNVAKKWKVRELLEAFSRKGSRGSICLSHLFTHRTFENGILGLAYVSSPRQYSFGGICSQPFYKDGEFLYLNTGLTTTRNSFGNRVLTRQAVLITAHELGHNWGAEHDPSSQDCNPKQKLGGSYIMNTFSVSSFDNNNKYFSICSKRSIKSVLSIKSKDCFSKPKETFCGNGILEKGEECDPGFTTDLNTDNCCTNNCRLKAGAQCSDLNSPCCLFCKFSSSNQICLESNEFDCKKESYCTGSSADCPNPDPLPNGLKCIDDGECFEGKCNPFCEKNGLISCMCDKLEDACKKCCKSNFNSTCTPYLFENDIYEYHKNGTICFNGFCNKGKCVSASQDYVERFWSIIDDIEINSFTIFLKDNLVGVVILISLIIFVPACYYVDKLDKKFKKNLDTKTNQHYKIRNNHDPTPKLSTNINQSILRKHRVNFSSIPNDQVNRVLNNEDLN